MFANTRTFDAASYSEHLRVKNHMRDVRKRKRGTTAAALADVEPHRPLNRSAPEPAIRRLPGPARIPPSDGARAQASSEILLGSSLDATSSPPPPYSRALSEKTRRDREHEIPTSLCPQAAADVTNLRSDRFASRRSEGIASLPSNTSPDGRHDISSPDVNTMVQTRLQKRVARTEGGTRRKSSSRRQHGQVRTRSKSVRSAADAEHEGGAAVALSDEACHRNASAIRPSHAAPPAIQFTAGGESSLKTCNLCQEAVPDVLECQDCATRVRLCTDCRGLHPSHNFREVQARSASPISNISTQSKQEKGKYTEQPPASCNICHEKLLARYFECQDCAGCVKFCPSLDCHELHPPQHKLKPYHHPAGPSEETTTEEGLDHTYDPSDDTQDNNDYTSEGDRQEELDEHVSDGQVSDEQVSDEYVNWGDETSEDGRGDGDNQPMERVGQAEQIQNADRSADGGGKGTIQARGQSNSPHKPDVTPPAGQLRRSRQPPQVTVTLARQSLLEFAEMAEAMAGTARKLLGRPQGVHERVQDVDADGLDQRVDDKPGAASLLDYDSDDAAFDDAPFDDNHHDHVEIEARSRHGRAEALLGRRWLPGDKQRLRDLKGKGLTNERIAEMLDRTPGAVSQQWRKQHGPAG